MADLFISYAREDLETVRAVHDALEKRGRHSWVDWEGIEPSDKWMESVEEAIDGADAFVLFMSPASLASAVCRRELEHAVSQKKRLIPIVITPFIEDQVPESVAELNWVFLRPTDDFDSGIDALVRAMDTDLDLIRLHTRVLTRAAAWEASRRQRASLLRGDDLRKAEAWIARAAAGAEPQPTQLQAAFVAESRRQLARRQKAIVSVSLVIAVVSMSLAAFAIVQRNNARKQAHIALSRQLAANALNNLQTRTALPLLLGVEASRMAQTTEAQDSLLSAIQVGLNARLENQRGPVNSVAFSPDGRLLAVGSGERFAEDERAGSVSLWDVATRTRLGPPFAIQGSVWSIDFSPDGKTLAATSLIGTYSLWDVATRKPVGAVPSGFPGVISLAFSPDGRAIAAGYIDGTVAMFDTASGEQIADPLAGSSDTVGSVLSVAFSPDGSIVAAGTESGRITLWDSTTHSQIGRPLEAQAGANSLAFTPDGRALVVGSGKGTVIKWDVAAHTQMLPSLLPLEGRSVSSVDSVALSSDGRRIASGNSDGSVSLLDAQTGQLLGLPFGGSGDALTVAFSPDGGILASGNVDGSVSLWNTALRDSIGTARGEGEGLYNVAPAPDASSLVLVRSDKSIAWWDIHSHTVLEGPVPGWDAGGIAISPDGKMIAATDLEELGSLIVSDVGAPSTSARVLETYRFEISVAFSPDGSKLAAGNTDGEIGVWDVQESDRIGGKFGTSAGGVTSVAFTPDGQTLAAGSTDGVIRFWDVRTHEEVRGAIRAQGGYVVSMAFAPDGLTLASGARDGTVSLWDLPSRRRLGSILVGLDHAIMAVFFSPDGAMLTSVDSRGTIMNWPGILWSRDVQALAHTACQLAGRSMTRAEWSRFLPDQPFDPVCPGPTSSGGSPSTVSTSP